MGPFSNLIAVRFQVRGTVQGVGFRPFVRRLASALGVVGWVRNDRDGVTILAEGPPEVLSDFQRSLVSNAPRAACVEEVISESTTPSGLGSFHIRSSESGGQLRARVPRDLASCDACVRESFDPSDRRHHYPFTN
ncbi:MAG: acylphosphatase, partial [Isosphaeraceae bacterium]